jgi:flagellar biosynthesis protein FliQ
LVAGWVGPSAIAPNALVEHAQSALMLSLAIVLPVLAVAAIVGLVVAAFQAASQIQDPTIAHLPRLLAVIAALALLAPWMGHQIAAFAERVFLLAGV